MDRFLNFNNEMLNRLWEYKNKYISNNSFSNCLFESDRVIKDINYSKDHMSRTGLSEQFNYICIPMPKNLHYKEFVMDMFYNFIKSGAYTENIIKNCVFIINISLRIFENLKEEVADDNVLELLDWEDIVNYFTGLNITNYIDNFIGCSGQGREIKEKVDELKEKINELKEGDN